MKKIVTLSLLSALALTSCQTVNPYTGETQTAKATQGAAIGALLGGVVGALSGDGSTDRRQKALLGAGIGALGGAGLGAYMDRQEAELRKELQSTGVGVRRVGDRIDLVMPGDITFATNSATVNQGFYRTLNSVSRVLNKYQSTLIDITGHTDSTGSRTYNYELSERRAAAVAGFLQSRRVNSARFRTSGKGPDYPAASNSTAQGRQKNRRVTINLIPLRAPRA